MYSVYSDGCFCGHFQNIGEAMKYVEERIRPFNHPWKVMDPYSRVYCQG